MASIKARQNVKTRKYLEEDEVTLILNEENSVKNVVSSLPIADEVKKRIANDSNTSQALKHLNDYSKGVCQITVNSAESNTSYSGSGFYIGDGWVVTTSNVVRNRNQVNNARFTFVSDQEPFSFEARERRAFVYRTLPPGRRPDYHNRDLTVIKLGVQYSFRQDVAAWEKDEQALLANRAPFSFQTFCKQSYLPPAKASPLENDLLCAVYFQTGQDSRRFHIGFDASRSYRVLEQGMCDFSGGFNAEASGCPVFVLRNGQCLLLGVFLPGPSSKPCGSKTYIYNGQAIVWAEELMTHIAAGIKSVDKMSNIVSYSLKISFEERKKLLNERTVYQAAELALIHRVLIL